MNVPLSTLLADAGSRTYFELTRLHDMTGWWHWMLLLVVCVGVAAAVVAMYRKDVAELPRGIAFLLVTLRLAAMAALLLFFLGPELRTERKLVKNSRFLLLIDTSQSMGLEDAPGGQAGQTKARIDGVVSELQSGSFLSDLRAKHDVLVYGFAQTNVPAQLASLPKLGPAADAESGSSGARSRQDVLGEARLLFGAAGGLLLLAAAAGLSHWLLGARVRTEDNSSFALLAATVLLIVGVVTAAVANLRNPDVGPLTAFTFADDAETDPGDGREPETDAAPEAAPEMTAVDWQAALTARGTETRLGEALRHVVEKERGGSAAGIAILSDGRSNAGIDYSAAAREARQAGIPVFTVGLGSERRPTNVRLVDLEAPPRVYPGDHFNITAFVQAVGLEGRSLRVALVSRPDSAGGENADETFEDEVILQLGPDGRIEPVKFELVPEEAGRRQYVVRAAKLNEDLDPKDNEKSASVEVVERKNRVLLLAGGPTREFRFLRNMLHRDRDTTVEVLLQSGQPGMAQEADDILFEFPVDPEEVFLYDCIVAFDPDWERLDELQVQTLERWVAEKAGGLLLVAGPVFMPEWTDKRRGDARFDTVKSLYPVTFFSRGAATLQRGRGDADSAQPIEFTDEGRRAEFLWLDDTLVKSQGIWAGFDGVFGFHTVQGAKPGASVYARLGGADSADAGDGPVYLAGQFYGAGRVFFQAGGEMWRLRALDEAHFEQYYTKLIRHVSQGRLLRDSIRGVLMVDKARCLLGDTVTVRATLSDSRQEPLIADAVDALLVRPDGARVPLTLRPVQGSARAGIFAAQFPALSAGDYRVELEIPESPENELLSRDIRVRGSNLEIERPERNDQILGDIARVTGGTYYVGLDVALGRGELPPLSTKAVPNDQTTFLPGTPDREFEQRLMTWLLAFICGVLSLEWLTRRLSKLA